jgi:hypothetical protein
LSDTERERREIKLELGCVALLIDAKSDHAARWYESYGAVRLLDAPLSLVLPFAMAIKALKQGN